MATVQSARDNFIRIGDIVTLKFLKHASYLSAEGIVVEDVFVSPSLKSFEEHQFQIYVQRQYSATNELEEFLGRIDPEDMSSIDQGTKNHMDALTKGKENESALNKSVMRSKTGNILSFGDTVQLLHVKSGKFVTVRPNDLARDERENMRVELSSDGSVMSWLKIIPRFKINREGEQITNNVEIQLRVLERSNEFLHCAERKPPRGKHHEVNSSLESPTPWRISIFQKTQDLKEKSLLLNGQLVYIRDPESQCVLAPLSRPLTITHRKLHKNQTAPANSGGGNELPQFQSAWSSKQFITFSSNGNSLASMSMNNYDDSPSPTKDEESDDESVSSIDEFVEENGDVIFKPFQESVQDSDAIWVMESKSITKGGVMKFRTEKVHFRHFNSGRYLSLKARSERSDIMIPYMTDAPSEKGTLFSLNQLHSTEENLINLRAVQLKHNYSNLYFLRGEYHDGQRVSPCLTTRSKGKSVSIILSRYEQVERKAFGAAPQSSSQVEPVLDINFGSSVMYHINRCLKAATIPNYSVTEFQSVWIKMDVADRDLYGSILARAALFVRGYPIIASASELQKIKPDKSSIPQRQNMFREQGLLQAMVNMLDFLSPIAELASKVKEQPNPGQKGAGIESCRVALSQTLGMLFDLIKGNLDNQLYIADHLLVILAHVSNDKMAANVARELLSSNRELQETRIGLKEVNIFADEMKKVPMNSMYLQLLQTCCSCSGEGLPKNQDIVYSVVFEENVKEILIEFRGSFDMPKIASFVDWGQHSANYDLYVGPHFNKGYLRGEKLCSDGPPVLQVSWTPVPSNTKNSPSRMYNRESMTLWEAFRSYTGPATSTMVSGSTKNMTKSKSESNAVGQLDSRRAVCDFFVAQLQVSAEMCLGRNYRVISQLEKIYSYEALVTIVKTTTVAPAMDVLKKSAAYLLQTLYVDRDPQSAVQLPRLTRTLTEISRAQGVQLVRVDGMQFYQFSLVQLLISRHLQDIRGKAFAGHTHNMVKLLQKLVIFNFYGEVEKLKDITELLIANLKRDTSDLEQAQEHTAMLSTMMQMTVRYNSAGSAKRGGSSKRHIFQSSKSLNKSEMDLNNSAGAPAPGLSTKNGVSTKLASVKMADGVDKELFPDQDGDHTVLDEVILPPWQIRMLAAMESVRANIVMTIFTVAAFGVSVYFEVTDFDRDIFLYFDYAVFVVYVIEFLLHFSLYVKVQRNPFVFFLDVFNLLDFVAIALYLIIAIGMNDRLAGYVKFARIFKAQRFLTAQFLLQVWKCNFEDADADRVAEAFVWNEPERYYLTPDSTIGTLVKISQVLCSIQSNIEDMNLSLVMKGYLDWANDPKASAESAYEIIAQVVNSSKELAISSPVSDDIYIDLLMYSHPLLVQVTLELLMIHHSSHSILMENVHKLQLISTEAGEEQFARMGELVSTLKRDADTHEIWGALGTFDHRKINTNMQKHLLELTENCRKLREVLKFDESHEPVVATQNILRNLGCFDLCMSLVQLISSIDKENPFAEVHVNTRNLALLSNRLLYWFILDNPANQAIAFTQLSYFIKTVDSKIESDRVISAIFRNNITLMESVSKKNISEFIELICNVGRFPQYLSLMSSIICVGEKNVIENQYEVIKLMSSPENVKKVVQYFVPTSHPSYAKKVALMAPYMQTKDVSVDALPSDLAYHLELINLLSSCTVGTSGMTTIEAKVQSMFNFVDVIDAMLDSNTILLAKIRLGLFLFNAMLDVETLLPAVKDADCIWKLLQSTVDVFSFAKDELRQIEKNGWDHPSSNRQKIEYVVVCLHVVHSYFSAYYDYTIFKPEVGQIAQGVERITLKEGPANDIIRSLYLKIAQIYEMVSPLLAEEHHQLLHNTLVALNNAAKEKVVAEVEDIHTGLIKAAEDYSVHSVDQNAFKSYDDFRRALSSSAQVTELVDGQVQDFIRKLEQIPWKKVNCNANVRFEPLIERLVAHIRGSISIVIHGDEAIKSITPMTTKTDIWVLRILRTMIENRWGMTIYERDDDGGEEQDDAVVELMEVYNSSGVTNMCLDLIAKGVDIALQSEALKLLVGMLFKEGGALEIQKTIYAHLSKAGSEMFFKNVRTILQNLMSWHKWNGVMVLEEGEDPALPDEIILVRCLQLMCEGHYGPNQDIFREQPSNMVSINLLDDFVLYLQALDNIKCRTSTAAESAVSALVLEVIQGPCEGNQDYFALNTELIETLNRKIRQRPVNDCDETEEIELKKGAIDIFQALLEGQARKTAVYERMLSVIHIDVILVLCTGEESTGDESGGDKEQEDESDESVELRTESLVLMQMLTDFRPSLKEEMGIDDNLTKAVGAAVACIEVVWRGELQRRFFHVPDICNLLAKSTKDSFIANVNRASAEDKLYGLLEATKEMYREILHQQLLTDYGVDKVFSRTNQDRATWLTFYLVLAMNILFTLFYHAVDVDCADIDDDAAISYENNVCTEVELSHWQVVLTVNVLNVALIALSFFVLLLYLVVRVPVNYQRFISDDPEQVIRAAVYTALDPVTVYYFFYLVIAIVGLQYHVALTFLLLDFISKSPTSQSVLKAVWNPRKQLFMTTVLAFIVTYVFSMYFFFFFNTPADGEENFADDSNRITLGNTFKFFVSKGLPQGTVSDYFNSSINVQRIVIDLGYFVSILLILNILKGITIDTFVELRKDLEERFNDTTEKCFICGIEKNTFNRTLDRTAFDKHTTEDQNLWSYVYFIIYIWQQDKDDDDGLESFVRKCIEKNDLFWFPMRKAIRLAEHQEKGDVHSMKFRFRKDLSVAEEIVNSKMAQFKDQLSRTIGRVEKSLEYEAEVEGRKSRATSRAATSNGLSTRRSISGAALSSLALGKSTPKGLLMGLESTSGDSVTPSTTPTPQQAAAAASFALSIPRAPSSGDSPSRSRKASIKLPMFTSALDADKLGQVHIKVISIVGLNIQQSQVDLISVRIISEMEQDVSYPDPKLERVKAYKTLLKNVATDTDRGNKLTHNKFRTSFVSVKALFKEQQNETGNMPEPTLLKFNPMQNPKHLIHQGRLPTVELSKYMVKVQIMYGSKGDGMKFLGGVHVPFVELLNKAHTGEPLEVPFVQRQVEKSLAGSGTSGSAAGALSEESAASLTSASDPSKPAVIDQNNFCFISLSAVASSEILQEWAMLMHHH